MPLETQASNLRVRELQYFYTKCDRFWNVINVIIFYIWNVIKLSSISQSIVIVCISQSMDCNTIINTEIRTMLNRLSWYLVKFLLLTIPKLILWPNHRLQFCAYLQPKNIKDHIPLLTVILMSIFPVFNFFPTSATFLC